MDVSTQKTIGVTIMKTKGLDPEILWSTGWSKGSSREQSVRLVVLVWHKGSSREEYSRHWQVKSGEFFHGEYFQRRVQAFNRMLETLKDYNQEYTEDHPSYVPKYKLEGLKNDEMD